MTENEIWDAVTKLLGMVNRFTGETLLVTMIEIIGINLKCL